MSPGRGRGNSLPLARLWKQAFPCLGIFYEDRTDRTVFGRLQDLLCGVARRVDRLRLPVGIELKHLRGDGFAHGVAHADVVVYLDAQFV